MSGVQGLPMKRLQTAKEIIADPTIDVDLYFIVDELYARGLITRQSLDFARNRIHRREHIFSNDKDGTCENCPNQGHLPSDRVSKELLKALSR